MDQKKSAKYLEANNLTRYLKCGARGQLKPDYRDLARLHQLAVSRKAFTVLEFGIGWSTIVLADALRINEEKWNRQGKTGDSRVANPFKLFSVDASTRWIETARKMIPSELTKYVVSSHSDVKAGLFNGRMCHFYETIPDVVPDLIYLDGPDPGDVTGSLNGLSWKNSGRTVMAGDILLMEPTLLPRTLIVIDGRRMNVRFLENNLQRKWVIRHGRKYTTMELVETLLGRAKSSVMRLLPVPSTKGV